MRSLEYIILGNYATTGDGLLVALEILYLLKRETKISKVFNEFKPTPQLLVNVDVKDKSIINSLKCKKAITIANNIIKKKGRLLVRKSGTESKIRIMAETNDKKTLYKCVNIVKRSLINWN